MGLTETHPITLTCESMPLGAHFEVPSQPRPEEKQGTDEQRKQNNNEGQRHPEERKAKTEKGEEIKARRKGGRHTHTQEEGYPHSFPSLSADTLE